MKQLQPLFIIGLILSVVAPLTAQQQFALHANEPDNYSPINAGNLNMEYLRKERVLAFGVSHRRQWTGLGDVAPVTSFVNAEFIDDAERSTVNGFGGVYGIFDQSGITHNNGLYVRGGVIRSFNSELSKGGISLGFNVGLVNRDIKIHELDPSVQNDPNLPDSRSVWYPDLGFGLFVYQKIGRHLNVYGGFSMPRVQKGTIKKTGVTLYPHYYAMAGCHFLIRDDAFAELSFWSRYVENVPVQLSVNLRGQFPIAEEAFDLGGCLSFVTEGRTGNIIFMPELNFNIHLSKTQELRVGYSRMVFGSSLSMGNSNELNLTWVRNLKR